MRQAARHVTQFFDHARADRFTHHAVFDPREAQAYGADHDQCACQRARHGSNHARTQYSAVGGDGLITIEKGASDARSKELHLTKAGAERFRAGVKKWAEAQKRFESTFGNKRSSELRALLQAVVTTELGAARDAASD